MADDHPVVGLGVVLDLVNDLGIVSVVDADKTGVGEFRVALPDLDEGRLGHGHHQVRRLGGGTFDLGSPAPGPGIVLKIEVLEIECQPFIAEIADEFQVWKLAGLSAAYPTSSAEKGGTVTMTA